VKFILYRALIINPAQGADAERADDGEVTVHLVAPLATVSPGASRPVGATPPAASDHVEIAIRPGAHADALWSAGADLAG
jgi:hypothetical protein